MTCNFQQRNHALSETFCTAMHPAIAAKCHAADSKHHHARQHVFCPCVSHDQMLPCHSVRKSKHRSRLQHSGTSLTETVRAAG